MNSVVRPKEELILPFVWICLILFHLFVTDESSTFWYLFYILCFFLWLSHLIYYIKTPYIFIGDNTLKLYIRLPFPKVIKLDNISNVELIKQNNGTTLKINKVDNTDYLERVDA